MAVIRSFRDLKTYQRARAEAFRIFDLSKRFPAEERYSLTDQIRRSSRAVSAMMGEAWARRRYEAVFVSKVSEALGEATETQVWLDHALACGYLTSELHRELDGCWAEIAAMLQGMIDKSAAFCGSGKVE
jgi:four helix bundle protein